jgi:hypothetical protein
MNIAEFQALSSLRGIDFISAVVPETGEALHVWGMNRLAPLCLPEREARVSKVLCVEVGSLNDEHLAPIRAHIASVSRPNAGAA